LVVERRPGSVSRAFFHFGVRRSEEASSPRRVENSLNAKVAKVAKDCLQGGGVTALTRLILAESGEQHQRRGRRGKKERTQRKSEKIEGGARREFIPT
jgi:hypothetical protein